MRIKACLKVQKHIGIIIIRKYKTNADWKSEKFMGSKVNLLKHNIKIKCFKETTTNISKKHREGKEK